MLEPWPRRRASPPSPWYPHPNSACLCAAIDSCVRAVRCEGRGSKPTLARHRFAPIPPPNLPTQPWPAAGVVGSWLVHCHISFVYSSAFAALLAALSAARFLFSNTYVSLPTFYSGDAQGRQHARLRERGRGAGIAGRHPGRRRRPRCGLFGHSLSGAKAKASTRALAAL